MTGSFDPIHAAVHEYNFPYGKTFAVDATNITGNQIRNESEIGQREIHLVAGGPPCQGISLMGRRMIDDPRNALLKEFIRIVLELQPRYFLMENVAELMVGAHRQLIDEIIEIAEASNMYHVLWPVKVLQAADFGVPQSRRRVILIGARCDVPLPAYPTPQYLPRTIKGGASRSDYLPVGPSVMDAIGDIPNADLFEELLHDDVVTDVEYGTPSSYAAQLRGEARDTGDYSRPRPQTTSSLTSSARTIHTRKSIARFEATDPGTTEKVSRFLRLHPEGICNTLRAGTASDRGAYTAPRPIHPVYPRVITVREAARLHSYPDWFRFHGTKWNGFRQIGNSVPPKLGRVVGSELLKADKVVQSTGEMIMPGPANLLYMTEGEAHAYFGLAKRVIPQRDRKVA